MAMELPIVATRHAGIPELLHPGTRGSLVSEGDVHAYASQMIRWIDHGLAPENRERIQEAFSLDNHILALLKMYAEITDNTLRS
jgi:glycosyltransferase involved in cell wall biosynthesis